MSRQHATGEGRLGSYTVMQLLAAAGGKGMTTTEIAMQFTSLASHQARSNRTSQILLRMERTGCARRGDREPTHIDVRALPVQRWFITPAGVAYVQEGPNDNAARLARREAKLAGWQAAADALRARQDEALQSARAAVAVRRASGSLSRCWRYARVMELRKVPCTLGEIGDVFGVTRERIRQIEAGRELCCSEGRCVQPTDSADS